MSRNTVEHVIRKFGSQQRVAELLGIWQTAVSGWVRRGAIPRRRQEELLAIARREGLELAPADFFVEADAAHGRRRRRPARRAASLEPRHTIPQGTRTAMTATTAEVIELKQPAVNRIATKDLYEIGEIPPLGHVPANMYAWAIRKDRHGEPISAMQQEVVPIADVGDDECLVMVMAGGRQLQRRLGGAGHPALAARRPQAALPHRRLRRVGHRLCGGLQGEAVEGRRRGRHPLQPGRRRRRGVQRRRPDELAVSQRIWGYETTDGSFAQFCKVQSRQLMPRPRHLTWEEAGCYTLVLATAFRMLFGHAPHTLKPGDNVLVWGGAGGLGSMATQLIAASGANAIAVISEEDKRDFVMSLGAKGAINRKDFDCWGEMPDPMDTRRTTTSGWARRASSARRSGTSPARATTSTWCSSIRAPRPSRSRPWSASAAAWW